MALACREVAGSPTCTTLAGVNVKMEIYPIKSARSIDWSDPINAIENPTSIVIYPDNAVTKNTAAVFQITKYLPENFDLKEDDARVVWTISSLGGDAKFFQGKNKGKKVMVYGTSSGEVLLEADYGWINKAPFRATVAELKQFNFRVNRVSSKKNEPACSISDIKKHIRIANIYLRQAAMKLVPDTSKEIARRPPGNPKVGDPGWTPDPSILGHTVYDYTIANVPCTDAYVDSVDMKDTGYFEVKVNDDVLTNTAASTPDQKAGLRVNALNETLNITYLYSINLDPSSSRSIVGRCVLNPVNHGGPREDPPTLDAQAGIHSATECFAIPTTSWVAPNGLPDGSIPSPPPDRDGPSSVPTGDPHPLAMMLFPAMVDEWQPNSPPNRDHNLLWGVVMDGGDQKPQIFGATLAHELGHFFGLRHRCEGGGLDQLPWPTTGDNLMNGDIGLDPGVNFPKICDLDVLQSQAMRFSEILFRPGAISAAPEYEPSDHRKVGWLAGALAGLGIGAVVGAIIGAVIGAAIGFATSGGNPAAALEGAKYGAAIGAGAGAIAGSIIGGAMGSNDVLP